MMTWANIRIEKTILALGLTACALIAGCSGSQTAPDMAVPAALDTAPPAVPTGLAASAVNTHVKVAWLPNNTDQDFAGFMLYRLAFGQVWPMLDKPCLESSFIDESPLRRPCGYAVTAIDSSGNESAWMEIRYQGQQDPPDRDLP